jgi:sugar lactone lactonase YvrE
MPRRRDETMIEPRLNSHMENVMIGTMRFAGMLPVALLVACSGRERAADTTPTDTSHAGGAAPSASKLGETTGMKTPESVKYDADLDVFYVANISGNPSQKDGNGFIARVRADSPSVVTTLVEGGKNGATLNAPKGMALSGDTLFVADIDAVRMFNRRTGAPLGSVDLSAQKATFLNDVVRAPDGVYVTDTGIRFGPAGEMTHPGVNRIFKLTGKTATEVARGDSLANPNGIAWQPSGTGSGRFLLAPFGGKDVQTWTPGSAPAALVSGPGQYDGIEVLADGRVLVSSWADSSVNVIQGGEMHRVIGNVSAPADIGVDSKRMVVAIPRFNDGKVEYYKIP